MSLKFQIITPERVVFSDEIDQVTAMTTNGEITVLQNHIPLVSVIKSGELLCKKDNEYYSMAVSGGFIEIRSDNNVVILADTAEKADEIDVSRAEEARERALSTMKEERTMDHREYAALQANLEKSLSRIKIGKKYKRVRGEISKN